MNNYLVFVPCFFYSLPSRTHSKWNEAFQKQLFAVDCCISLSVYFHMRMWNHSNHFRLVEKGKQKPICWSLWFTVTLARNALCTMSILLASRTNTMELLTERREEKKKNRKTWHTKYVIVFMLLTGLHTMCKKKKEMPSKWNKQQTQAKANTSTRSNQQYSV